MHPTDFSGEVNLGADVNTGKCLDVPMDAFKSTGTHVVGAAGYGKSYFLRLLIREFIHRGQGFAVVDPHTELCDYAVGAIEQSGIRRDRVVVLDPGEAHTVGFNPLRCGVQDPAGAASLTLEAVLKAWGTTNFDQTPRLEGLLRNTFRLLVDNDLTLVEAPSVIDVDNVELRQVLAQRVTDPLVREDWVAFDKWPRAERIAIAESTRNRLRRILQSDAVRMMLGQSSRTLDVKRLMDAGGILIANVGNTATPETKRLLGALTVNAIYHAAKQRNPRNRRDFFVVVDEAAWFATRDLANSLDELRKFGVHFILAHQRLAQLDREDPDVMSAVMTNCKVKVVFGGLEYPEAQRMTRELFTGEIAGERVKHVTTQTKFRPVLDWVTVESESWSATDSASESSSISESEADVVATSDGAAYAPDADGYIGSTDDYITSRTLTRSSTQSTGLASSRSHSAQHSATNAGSRSRTPVTVHEEFREETGRQFASLEEELERFTAQVHRLPKREAFVRFYNGPVMHVRTAEVTEPGDARQALRFKRRLLAKSPHAASAEEAAREIEERRRRLAELVAHRAEATQPRGARRSFRE